MAVLNVAFGQSADSVWKARALNFESSTRAGAREGKMLTFDSIIGLQLRREIMHPLVRVSLLAPAGCAC